MTQSNDSSSHKEEVDHLMPPAASASYCPLPHGWRADMLSPSAGGRAASRHLLVGGNKETVDEEHGIAGESL